jgi:DNA sulfur modification protein DndB
MATLLPAMQGKFGSNDFWIVTMPAKELTERLTIPKEIDGWEEMSIEERYQREIDYNRVRKQIAPYLASDEDRFFGAFIVSVLNGDQMEFQPLGDMVSKIPALYRTAGSTFGFLTLEGNEILVPLDGQHRLAALEFAITGKDEKQKPIAGIDTNTEVAKDVCTVILLRHHREKSRKIFNKVNRYARVRQRERT